MVSRTWLRIARSAQKGPLRTRARCALLVMGVSVAIAVGAPGGLLVLLGWLFQRDQQRATTARYLNWTGLALVGVGFAAPISSRPAPVSAHTASIVAAASSSGYGWNRKRRSTSPAVIMSMARSRLLSAGWRSWEVRMGQTCP